MAGPRQDGEVSKTVLVVDDEAKIVEVVGDYLRGAGFSVTTAADGEGAVASARARPPDLVVLDLGLPGLDGLDVARELRRASQVPIIMLRRAARRPTGYSGWSWGGRLPGQAVQPPGAAGPGAGGPAAHRGRADGAGTVRRGRRRGGHRPPPR